MAKDKNAHTSYDREVDDQPKTAQPPPLPGADDPVNKVFADDPVNRVIAERAQRQANAVSSNTPEPYNPFLDFTDEEVSERFIKGTMLKFNKGDFLAGIENIGVPVGTKFVANMSEMLIGWIRWEDQKPVEHRVGAVADSFKPPHRDMLGYGYQPGMPTMIIGSDGKKEINPDIDTSDWEVDAVSKIPRDPWVDSVYIVLKDPTIKEQDEGIYTFASGSKGGRDTITDLRKWYGKRMAQHPGEYPIVALKLGGYPHPNKQLGRIKTPHLVPTHEWCPSSIFGDDVILDSGQAQIAGPNDNAEKPIPF